MGSTRKSFTSKKRRPQSKSPNHGLRQYRERFSKLRLEPLEDRRLLSTIMSAQMNSNPGWTISGQWAFGQPQGLTQNPGVSYPDPTSGYTGLNVYGVNLYGDYNATVGGPYFLKTSAIDCSNYTNINLSFRRWLNTDAYDWVSATIDVSNNGTTWNRVWNNTDGIVDNTWQLMQYDISAYANNQSTVYIRWGYQVFLSEAYQCSGWNIDDVLVTGDLSSNPPGVTVNPTTGLTTTEAGGTASFTMVLNSQPTADVTIGLSSSDTTEGTVSPSSVTFTTSNWSTPRTVTVTGVNDTLVDGNIAYSIVTAPATSADANYNGLNASDVSVTNQDNDTAALTLSIAAPSVSEAGGPAATTGTVTRNFDLSNPLVVTLTSSDTSEATVPSTVTISANQTSATFNIAAVNDALIDGTQTVTITASAPFSSGQFASDTSFGTSGVVTTTLRNNISPQYTDLEIQTDGKILAIGRNATADDTWDLIRVLVNGSYDAAFGTAGKVSTTFSGETMVRPAGIIRHEDGKITIVGNTLTAWLLARYNSDGSPDTTFSGDGQTLLEPISSSRIYDGVPNTDGSIFVVGERYDGQGMILGRVLANGTLDTSFGTGGIVSPTLDPASTEYAYAMLQQPDGKLVIAGRSDYNGINDKYFVARFNTNGALDTTFSGDGFQSIDLGYLTQEVNSLALQADGRIVLAGYVSTGSPNYASDWGVVRVDANGNLDASFSGDGIDIVTFNGGTQDDTARDVVIQSDGKIVVVGSAFVSGNGSDRAFVRYNSDGSRDTSFGSSGIQILPNLPEVWEEEWAAAIQADGKLVTYSGYVSNYRIERYILPGSLVATATLDVTDDDDTLPPTVTGQVPAANSTINASSVNIDVTFSKPVVGVDATDLVLSGAAAAAAVKGTPTNISGTTWRFPVSGLSNGALTISLAPDANDIEDSAGRDLANVVWNYTVSLGFFNSTTITIPSSGSASPYPSTINVSGLSGTITDVNVTLNGLTHTWPDDIDILLVGPAGQKVLIMSDTGGGTDISGVNLTFDDAAANPLTTSTITSGTYKPTNLESTADTFPSPAPASPYAAALTAFNGTNPNGTWSLYVYDDASPDSGSISGGWSLSITSVSATAGIGNLVWNDLNSNGAQDAGEPGVAGAGVELYSSSDSTVGNADDLLVAKTATDSNGNYAFGSLAPGNYYLTFRAPVGFTFASQDAGGDDGLDSDANATGVTALFVLASDQTDATRDAGLVGSSPGFGFAFAMGQADVFGAKAVATDAAGNVYVTGDFRGAADFDPGPGTDIRSLYTGGDIFVAKYSSAGALLWARPFGGPNQDGSSSIAVASDGSVYTTGWFQGTVDFDPGPAVYNLTASGAGIFVSKLNSEGNFVWARSLTGNDWAEGTGITVANDGSICFTGHFGGTIDFNPGAGVYNLTSVNRYDAFVTKWTAAGDFTWARSFGGMDSTIQGDFDIAVASNGDIFTTGQFVGAADFDPGAGTFYLASAGDHDIFISKLDSAGNFLAAWGIGGISTDDAYDIALAADGSVYTTGFFSDTVDFDPGAGVSNLTSAGYKDIFVLKLDASGNYLWSRRIGGASNDIALGIDVAGNGNVYTTGYFLQTVDFDPGPAAFNLTPAGNWDIFISALNSAGNFVGAYKLGGTSTEEGNAIAVTSNGTVFVAGDFYGTVDFDPGAGTYNLSSIANDAAFLFKLSPDLTSPAVTGRTPAPSSTIISSSVNIEVTFSEVVQGIDATDLVLSGTAAVAAVVGTPTNVSGNTWRFPVSGLVNGNLNVSLAPDANDIEDSSGNDLANIAWSYTVALTPSNPTSITIPSSGSATPYPSTINVSGLSGTISDVNVTLTGLTHTYPGDIDILLVGPGGQKVLILSDAGGGLGISGVNLTLDDAASAYVSSSLITSGTFKPTNIDSTTDSFSSPAPAGPYASTLAAFNGTTPNGTWSLYVVDDASGDLGSISGGWALAISTISGNAVIGDKVWNDLDTDGAQDAGEPGIPDWEVYLDSNTNGQWDSGEPKTATDANGNYAFNALLPGTYRVATVPRTMWVQSFPASAAPYTITLTDGEIRSDVDFGNIDLQTLPAAEIRSTVWKDMNGNGIQDAGEPGVAGATVEIYSSIDATIGNSDDVFVARTVTDSAGNYVLGNLPPILNHYLIFRTPVGYTFTTKDVGGDDSRDSDATSTGATALFALSSGQIDSTRDAGLVGVSPSFGFALGVGGASNDAGESVTTDAAGNIYVSGYFTGTADFDPGPGTYNLTSAGSADIFIAKYSPNGTLNWARRMGGADNNISFGIAVSGDGSIYTTGYFIGTADFDPGPGEYNLSSNGNYSDIYISKLDSAGNFVWAKRIGGSWEDYSEGITIASDGNIYITGAFGQTADFDPGPGTFNLTSSGIWDVFVTKLDPAGNLLWAGKMGGTSSDWAYSIATAADGSVYVTGQFYGTADFDPGTNSATLTSSGNADIFISKLDSSGNFAWARRMGSSEVDTGESIAVASDGSVYTTGAFYGTVDFDPNQGTFNLISSGDDDIFVSKLDSAGNFLWARGMGGTGEDQARSIALASDGSIYSAGYFQGIVDFDPGAGAFNRTSAGEKDIFLSRLDANGGFVSAQRFGGSSTDYCFGIAVGIDNSVYTTGSFMGVVDFDPGINSFNLTSGSGYADMFVSKLIPGHAPSDVLLSANLIAENQAIGSVIGSFSSTDPDPNEAFNYSLASGSGSDDNALFTIDSSGQLKTAAILDFETKPAYSIRVRTTDYSGMWYEKVFMITATDVPEAFVVIAANWTAVGLTVRLGADGKLHAYRTGTTIDAVPPHVLANVTGIQITGRSNADDELTVDFSMGNMIPAGGLIFNGGTQLNGDSLVLKGTSGDDDATLSDTQLVLAGLPAINFSNVEFFGFDLGTGKNSLLIDHTTLRTNRNDAFSPNIDVTVDGGTLDFGGFSNPIGNLVLKDNAQAIMTAVQNVSTTVTSGTLTATSIVCDTLTIGSAISPTTRTWDGGGADNKWSTAANWAGDVAPLPGDNLVFPVGAAKLENINDYPPGTAFGSIDVSGANYLFQNGIVSSSTVHVSSGTLTTSSMICDTLLIGSTSETAAAPARSLATDSVTLTAAVPHSVASNLATTTNVGQAPLATKVIHSPIQVDPPRLDIAEVVSIPANQAASVPYSVGTLSALSSVRPIVQHVIPTREIASTVISMTTKDQPANKTEVALPLPGLFADAFIADLNSTARTISFNPFQLTERLKDSVYEESTDSAAETTKQLSIGLSESQSARSLALQSLMQDSQYHFGSNQINSKLVGNKRSCKPDKLVNEAVDEFHADFAGAID